MLDKLHAVGLIRQGSDRKHQVARYVAVLSGFPAKSGHSGLADQLRRLFGKGVIRQIEFLDSLVPSYPAAGALAARNHEYPFQDTRGRWRAPTDDDVFGVGEMKRVRECAGRVVGRLRRILDALDLVYPQGRRGSRGNDESRVTLRLALRAGY